MEREVEFPQRHSAVGIIDSGAGICSIMLAGIQPWGIGGGSIDPFGTRGLCKQTLKVSKPGSKKYKENPGRSKVTQNTSFQLINPTIRTNDEKTLSRHLDGILPLRVLR